MCEGVFPEFGSLGGSDEVAKSARLETPEFLSYSQSFSGFDVPSFSGFQMGSGVDSLGLGVPNYHSSPQTSGDHAEIEASALPPASRLQRLAILRREILGLRRDIRDNRRASQARLSDIFSPGGVRRSCGEEPENYEQSLSFQRQTRSRGPVPDFPNVQSTVLEWRKLL